ncbi:hypothetical protein NMY22_g6265 [Coprinellus aureogranulatus]|nr:hypothetical protein NMY22_g6265 [Coprinellus aureogranulatus]
MPQSSGNTRAREREARAPMSARERQPSLNSACCVRRRRQRHWMNPHGGGIGQELTAACVYNADSLSRINDASNERPLTRRSREGQSASKTPYDPAAALPGFGEGARKATVLPACARESYGFRRLLIERKGSTSSLFSRFAGPSIYLDAILDLLLDFDSCTTQRPFLFNPHRFAFSDSIINFREFSRWMRRGNSKSHSNSWIGDCRLSRTMITSYRKKSLRKPSLKLSGDVPRATRCAVIPSEIIFPVRMAVLFVIAYLFVKSFPADGKLQPSPLIRIAVILLDPFSIFQRGNSKFGAVIAFTAHALGTLGMVGLFEFFQFLELWNAARAVLDRIAVIAIPGITQDPRFALPLS